MFGFLGREDRLKPELQHGRLSVHALFGHALALSYGVSLNWNGMERIGTFGRCFWGSIWCASRTGGWRGGKYPGSAACVHCCFLRALPVRASVARPHKLHDFACFTPCLRVQN